MSKLEEVALVALQGLLASGHYTTQTTSENPDVPATPSILRYDTGEDWKEDGRPSRYSSHAAADAFVIAQEFFARIGVLAKRRRKDALNDTQE